MMERVLRFLPSGLTSRLAKHALPIAILAALFLVVSGLAVALLVSPSSVGLSGARVSETTDLPQTLQALGLNERDTDHDGLSDALENYVYGTDPNDWNSSGLGIPDGWLVQYGFDPLSPLTKEARGAAPPTEKLPPAYATGYPTKFTPSLQEYYDYARPAAYKPGVDAPWWRTGPHADPADWDQSRSGVPTGWLLYYGLDPQHIEANKVAAGSKSNLTIKDAFAYDTDPLRTDSDLDGIDDWTEIHVTQTDPSKFSTSGARIADGWLLHYGLNLFDRNVGSQDPDLDGLTNFEEFLISQDTFSSDVAKSGISVLFTKGLDPLEWQSAHSLIPDGWYVKYFLSPFGGEVDRVIARASDWPEIRNLHSAPEGYQPIPDLAMTVRDAYTYGRPTDWNESIQGVWWGGTNPQSGGDSDNDGIPDVVEIRGWYANVTTEVGPDAKPKVYLATSNPLQADSDGDGLSDHEEYGGRSTCGGGSDQTRTFPPTDPRNRDTAFSGLTDLEKVCGVTRGQFKYDLHNATDSSATLDPTKADSAADLMLDGARLDFWHQHFVTYKANPRYAYNDSAYRTLYEWTTKYERFGSMSHDEVLSEFRPDGDVDGDGIPNVLDADPSGGLYADKFDKTAPKTKVFSLGGPKMDPSLYRYTEFASAVPHSASDPANPDTDGDGLPDWWETRYGVFDPQLGGWNLDPAKADSNGDGITDDKANNDGDVVTWYAYLKRGDSTERVPNTWPFDNMLEFIAGTDPNEVSSAGDGVPDGWKAFWASRVSDDTYPNLFASRDTKIGDVALAHVTEIESALASSSITTLANLRGLGTKATGYIRFVSVSACGSGLADAIKPLLKGGEVLATSDIFADHSGAPCFAGQVLDGSDIKVARVAGAFHLTYKKEADLRTNPYMADTDGDGVPDAYEAYYLVRSAGGTAYPDPVTADGEKDNDKDGLALADECASQDGSKTCGRSERHFLIEDGSNGAGSDPNVADTDGDGIQDGIEFNADLDALDPSDVESFRDPRVDSDHDGVPDYQELTGWGKGDFGVSVRTDPQDPDSNNDGLLDGDNIAIMYKPGIGPASVADWCMRGIAHQTQRADGTIVTGLGNVCGAGMSSRVTQDLLVTFLGTRTYGQSFGFRPDGPSEITAPGGIIVPDGWLAYYGQNPKEKTPDSVAYTQGRPAWWSESLMGPWWCGAVPDAASPIDDLDADGLNDKTGEDPFPSLRLNQYVSGATSLTDATKLAAFVKAGTAGEISTRAQAACDGAGDPGYARSAAMAALDANGVPTRLDRARVSVLDLTLVNGTTITKGAPFGVTGRVVLNEADRIGVANRTVLIGAFGPDRGFVLGIGYSNATGAFNITANVTSDISIDVPDGLITLGVVNGTVHTHGDPSTLATGDSTNGAPNTIVAWVTNTSATVNASSPLYGSWQAWLPDANGTMATRTTHATAFAVSAALPVRIHADTRLTTTLGTNVDNGATLVGDLLLEDASGAPLIDRNVHLRWTGSEPPIDLGNMSTSHEKGHEGVVNLTNLGLLASVTRADQYALIATFVSSDANLAGTTGTFPIAVRDPTAIHARLDRASATVGDPITVQGTLATGAVRLVSGAMKSTVGVAGVTIRASLGGADDSTRTDENGAFTLHLTVPGSLAAGPTNVKLNFAGTTTQSPTDANLPIAIQRTARLVGLTSIEGPRSIQATLHGTLMDNEGQGFAGDIIVQASGARVATGKADEKGAFKVIVSLNKLSLGSQPLTVVFPGDAGHAPASNFTEARVTSTTTLALRGAPTILVRGQSFPLTVTLLDDDSQPVPGTAVAVYWRGARVLLDATDAKGEVKTTIFSNVTERPAIAALGAESRPQPTSVYQPSTAEATVRVVQGTLIEFAPATVERGPIAITGRLLDDEERPLAAALVEITFADKSFGGTRTARNGSFELQTTLPPDTPLGPVMVLASYRGTTTLSGVEQALTWHVRSPLVPRLTQLGPFVRGEEAIIAGRVVDDQGQGVDAMLLATLGGRDIGVVRIVAGSLHVSLMVPKDLPRGETVLTLHANATDKYEAFAHDYSVVVKIRPQVSLTLPSLAIRGFSFGSDVVLRDDKGQPLRNTSFVFVVGKGSATLGQTDASGKATLAAVAPLSGGPMISLTVRGGDDVVAAEYRSQALNVVGPATPVGYAGL
ncbi:MAG: hypothetical protein WDA16_05950, partial [Candidatus Thermoplasmatota archaeon]